MKERRKDTRRKTQDGSGRAKLLLSCWSLESPKPFALTAAMFFMAVAISSPASGDSFSGYWTLDARYSILDTGYSIETLEPFKSFNDLNHPRASRVNDLRAQGEVERNRELSDPIADPLSPVRPKSPGKAFFLSAVVPGTGELYSKAKRGVLFTVAEVALWTAYFVFDGRGEELKEDYVKFCDEHIVFEEDSPASSTENWTLEDYEHATQSDNWHYVYTESAGEPDERVGKFYWADLPEEWIDEPGGKPLSESQSQFRMEAFQKRSSTNDKFKQAKRLLGLVVINHIISAIDGRIAATMYNNRISETGAEISLRPTVSPSGHPGAYLTLYGWF